MRKNKLFLYGGLALAAWYFYQKKKGNNIFGQPTLQPVAVTAQLIGPTPAAIVANATAIPGVIST